MRKTMDTPDEKQRAMELAEQVAGLLAELDSLTGPGRVNIVPGRIVGPGLEITRDLAGDWTARTCR
ncbi:hypothetical protein [Streptomyces sp. NPDC053720]|uniref:hypothetical protein n=1 Tax=Streptomyces sp. NPDC053720 TaxID=3154855 RepID=UPI00343267C2